MVLEVIENGKRLAAPVEARLGAAPSPLRGKAHTRWTLRAGERLAVAQRPGDRVVELYRGTPADRLLLASIHIRYFPDREGRWVPKYQLQQDPVVAKVGERWLPLTTAPGAANLIVLFGNTLPDASGFYSALDFGLGAGALQIDSWIVK